VYTNNITTFLCLTLCRSSPQEDARYYLSKVKVEAALFDQYVSGSISGFFYGIWHKWVTKRSSPSDISLLQALIDDANTRLIRGRANMHSLHERILRHNGPDIPEWREADRQIRRVEQAVWFACEVQDAAQACLEVNPSRVDLLFKCKQFGFQRWNEID
jgi:hypothetical protein